MKPIFTGWVVLFLALIVSLSNSYALCVNVPTANLRGGPGEGYEAIWKVYRYMPLLKVGASLSGDWYAVKDVDGEVEWVHKSLVSSRDRCAVVKTDTARIRTGPGLKYPQKYNEPAVKYESFKVVQVKRKWVQVADGQNRLGWISKDLLWLN